MKLADCSIGRIVVNNRGAVENRRNIGYIKELCLNSSGDVILLIKYANGIEAPTHPSNLDFLSENKRTN